MNQTIAEKLLSARAGRQVRAGEIVVVPVDGTMATDATAPFAIAAFRKLGRARVWDADRVALVLDHATPAPNERVANLHRLMRAFSAEQNIRLYDIGDGICHQLMVENDHVRPGDIFLGADSHTPTYGALGAFAIGVGSTDMAAVWRTGQTWLRVPHSIRIELHGTPPASVSAKDIILHLTGRITMAGAVYDAVEFAGPTVAAMTLASRMVLANMVAEMGAKTGMVETTGLTLPYAYAPVVADAAASYRLRLRVDVSALRPQVAVPHQPDAIRPIDELIGIPIDATFIGSCTNSRLEDLHAAADVLRGRRVSVRLVIAPASRAVFNAALQDGTIATLSAAGATFITSGCGPCVGTHQGVPGDDEAILSSTNRNFQGRMGNPRASIYLASPAVVAAAAVAGQIVDPGALLPSLAT